MIFFVLNLMWIDFVCNILNFEILLMSRLISSKLNKNCTVFKHVQRLGLFMYIFSFLFKVEWLEKFSTMTELALFIYKKKRSL